MFCIEQSAEFGTCLRAVTDIPAGTTVTKEEPAFFGPSADYVEDYSTPICLGCAVVMNEEDNSTYRCPKCQWPLCGPNCDKASYHEGWECDLLAKEKVSFPPESLPIQNCYKGLTILRGVLLRDKDPRVWEKVMKLQYENEIKQSAFQDEEDFNEFKTRFGLSSSNVGSNEDWRRVLGILNVNSYSIQRIEKKIGSPSFAEFIYSTQCLMNHSCSPNCNWAITYSPDFNIHVKAAMDIKKGEMLTVAYNPDLLKYGCSKRQQRIREEAKFSCKCSRCRDPTDFGTFSDAVICFRCKKGVMLPVDCLNPDPEADWKCDSCDYRMCQSFVSSFLDSLVETIEMVKLEAGEEDGDSATDIWEDFISEKAGSVLHSNHWVLTLAAQSIINQQCSRLHELSLEDLDRLIGHCEHILSIRKITVPGISSEKGILQHHLARSHHRRLQCTVGQKGKEEETLTSDEMEKVKQVYELQKSVSEFWKENPHYGTLHHTYKLDAQLLMDEMEELKNKYNFLN